MEQINTEWGWTNKEKLDTQKHVVENLLQKAQAQGVEISAQDLKALNNFINAGDNIKLKDSAAKELDGIINRILKELTPGPGSYGGGQSGGGGAGSTF